MTSLKISDDFNSLEKWVLEFLLAGEDPVLDALRKQITNAKLESREFTGVGFFTNIKINKDLALKNCKQSFEIGDVYAESKYNEHGIGLVLFIREGLIDWLEGFVYIDKWPDETNDIVIHYVNAEGNQINKRDLKTLRKNWVFSVH